jgi:hypothetical protein
MYEWITMFQNDRKRVIDEEQGHESIPTTQEGTEKAIAIVLHN